MWAALSFGAAAVGVWLGDGYIARMPHHAGFFLVTVRDEVAAPLPARPRHTVVIVVDGLRADAAETMRSAQRIAARGQCRIADQGDFTVSRPVYALLSTGLEADRTGSRNNDRTDPLAAESIWQVARSSGLRVVGSSHLPWFQQLFPEGFDAFRTAEDLDVDVFADTPDGSLLDGDVALVHPLYVDETAHAERADSPAYRAAVARADAEIGRLLDRLDLARDLVLLTSDHGHRDAGGHGGTEPEVRHVLDCLAGPHVAPAAGRPPLDGRTTAPLLAVLLGLPFPSHMRAGDDGLDAIWSIARFGPEDGAYVADRRAAIARFRRENEHALRAWVDPDAPATWPAFRAQEARSQALRIAGVGLAIAAALGIGLRRTFRERRILAAATAGWIATWALTTWAAHRAILGAFSFTVINRRSAFVPHALLVALTSLAIHVVLHVVVLRRLAGATRTRDARRRLEADLLLLVALLLVVNVGHIAVYGWPLGYPLPPPAARYVPFFGAIALVVHALAAGAAILVGVARDLRRGAETRPSATTT